MKITCVNQDSRCSFLSDMKFNISPELTEVDGWHIYEFNGTFSIYMDCVHSDGIATTKVLNGDATDPTIGCLFIAGEERLAS